MPYLSLSGRQIHYSDTPHSSTSTDTTSPKTLILIHGLGSSQNYYYPILPLLTSHRTIAFDTYGAGRSPYTDYTQSIETIADDVLRILDALKVERAIVVGHSMGGIVASHLAATAPERVEAVVAIGPVQPSKAVAEVFEKRIAVVEKDGMEPLANMIPFAATGTASTPLQHAFIRELIISQNPQGYISSCKVIANASLPDYSSIVAPFLLIIGDEDKSAPGEGCEAIFAAVGSQRKRLETLSRVGHWHVIEAPDAVGRLIREFVDSL